jgi:putative transposase
MIINQILINMQMYSTNLTDSQWQYINKLVDPDERKRKYCLKEIMNAVLYITKSGVQWRLLPHDFAPWQVVYYYFRKWKNYGIIEDVHDYLVAKTRVKKGKKAAPTAGIIDSQSAKASNICQGEIGYDGGKKVKGRKRHIVVDTMGLILTVVIHAANVHDSVAAKEVFRRLSDKYLTGLQLIFADGGYLGDLIEWTKMKMGWELRIVKRNEVGKFKVLPKRWIVERTFAWISFHRRMAKDYERLSDTSVAFIQLSMIRLMLNKI